MPGSVTNSPVVELGRDRRSVECPQPRFENVDGDRSIRSRRSMFAPIALDRVVEIGLPGRGGLRARQQANAVALGSVGGYPDVIFGEAKQRRVGDPVDDHVMSRQLQVAADPTAPASVATRRAISWRKTAPMMTIEQSPNFRLSERLVLVRALRVNIVSLRKIVERK